MPLLVLHRYCLAATLLAASVAGCATWNQPPAEPVKLPAARMSPDSVVLEMAFVRMPVADPEANDAIWAEIDEQHFDPELRHELAANGLRIGILGQHLPTQLRAALEAASTSLTERPEDVDTSDTQINRSQRRLTCRTGRRAKVYVSKTHPSLALFTQEEGRVRGLLLDKAQCLFSLKPYPQGDSRVRLDLTPEVEHGEMRAEWVSLEGAMIQRIGRERHVLDRLRTVATLSPGQVLVVSTTPDIKGLGEHFFTETADGRLERTLLLVRVAQTQWDDLFAPEQISAPLATPVE
ncbi:MAG: hypothetical protein WD872_17185 [Pirellulaceae bacterium]